LAKVSAADFEITGLTGMVKINKEETEAGQLVAPKHQVTRTRQRVLLLRKPLGTNNAVNTASCAGMTRLTLIGAILADYGSQSMFCLAVVACLRTVLSTHSPLIDSSPRRLPRSAHNTADAPPPAFSLPRSAASFTAFTLLTVDV